MPNMVRILTDQETGNEYEFCSDSCRNAFQKDNKDNYPLEWGAVEHIRQLRPICDYCYKIFEPEVYL